MGTSLVDVPPSPPRPPVICGPGPPSRASGAGMDPSCRSGNVFCGRTHPAVVNTNKPPISIEISARVMRLLPAARRVIRARKHVDEAPRRGILAQADKIVIRRRKALSRRGIPGISGGLAVPRERTEHKELLM